MALTKKEQKAILKCIPAAQKKAVREHVRKLHQSGSGVMDILKSVSNFLGPIISQVGPTVLKEFIIPFIKKQMSGNGVELPGSSGQGICHSSCGSGLKLAGQGDVKPVRVKKSRLVKGSQEAKDHMSKLRAMRKPKKI